MQAKLWNINDLIRITEDELQRHGVSLSGLWRSLDKHFGTIRTWFIKSGTLDYSDEILEQYVLGLNRRWDERRIARKSYIAMLLAADRLREVAQTGKLEWGKRPRGTKFRLGEAFETLLGGFSESLTCAPTTRGDVIWAVRRYLSFMESQGVMSPDKITVRDVRNFIVFSAAALTLGSLANIRCYVRKLHAYMAANDICALSETEILNVRISRKQSLRPGMSREEFLEILDQVGNLTVKAKRDRAILLLAVQTGLRGVDIVNLKLTDIDWRNDELHLIQCKTNTPIALPLLPEAREAIIDYILNGRPLVDSEYIFLKTVAPIRKMSDSMGLDHMLRKYQTKAGIERLPWDGKGFHSIRRMLGKDMVVAGVPVTTVSDVLGQAGPDSLRPYIALDSDNLKICALDFSGIPLREEARNQ